MMDDKFSQLSALIGQSVEVEDPADLDQCMDLAFKWCDILSIDRATIRHQFAYQVYTQPFDLTVQKFCLIPNTPNGVPQKGDLVVFDKDIAGVTGNAGHICIATGEGDVNNFKSLDQNWNGVLHVTQENHAYTGVLGWLRIQSDQQSLIDQLRIDRDTHYNNWKADEATIANLNNLSKQKDSQISTLNQKATDLANQLESKDMTIQTLQTQALTIPQLTKERDQAVGDRDACLKAEVSQQALIKKIQGTHYAMVSTKTLLWEIFDRITNKKAG